MILRPASPGVVRAIGAPTPLVDLPRAFDVLRESWRAPQRRPFVREIVQEAAAPAYRTSTAGGGTIGTTDRTATITPAVDDLLVVFCCASANANTTPTCTDDNGGTYTRIDVAGFNASASTASWFVRTALMVNTTSTVVTMATGSNNAGQIVIVAIGNMGKAGAAAVRSTGKQADQPSGDIPAPALNQGALTSNVTLTAVFCNTITPGLTPPTSWTTRQNAGQSTPSLGLQVCSRNTGFTGTTITWGSATASVFASCCLEIDGTNAGVLGSTIDPVTVSGTATVATHGTAADTIDPVTASGTATAVVHGTEATTIDPVTASGAAAAKAAAALAATIDPIAIAAAGAATTHGTAADTIDPVTAAGTGAVLAQASAAIAVDPVTAAAGGAAKVAGGLAITIDPIAEVGAGAVRISGAAAITLAAVTTTATSVARPWPSVRVGARASSAAVTQSRASAKVEP